MNARIKPEVFSEQPVGAVFTIDVARSLDQILKVIALRAIVYMSEQDCPYSEEVDGNDLAGATHLIAESGGEPVGCLRIRWFADFFKIERVAVLPSHRKEGIAAALMAQAIEIGSRKGYRRLCGHVSPHLLDYWGRNAGVRARPGRPRFSFSGIVYAEVERDLPKASDALTMDSDPLVLLRPEGAWDRPGPLERSEALSAPLALSAFTE